VGGFAGGVGGLAATRYEDLALFTSVLDLVRQHYFEPIEERKLLHGAVRGMLRELDPHSSFMDVDVFQEVQADTKGEFDGLGIEVTKRKDGFIEVVSPIEGTPAARAGIRARDRIDSLCPTAPPDDWTEECRSTRSMTLFEAVKLMRGSKGTKITIRVHREGFEQPQPYTIVRDRVKIVSVSGRMLEPTYAYLRIRVFQERTGRDLERTLEKLHDEAEGSFEGLILDLRDNPGGLLEQAVEVADAWLTEDLIVYTRGRVDSEREEFRAHAGGAEPRYPIAVLVNAGTASSSEIVAGALQDRHRALVIGTKTFGKGSVQTVFPLEGGAGLRLTTALYYTPRGRSIQEAGISPDIVVEATTASEATEGPTLPPGRELEGGAPEEGAAPQAATGARDSEAAAESDVQLDRALEVLKSWTYFERLKPGW
jgi:carboxyl-terminal processing protease